MLQSVQYIADSGNITVRGMCVTNHSVTLSDNSTWRLMVGVEDTNTTTKCRNVKNEKKDDVIY